MTALKVPGQLRWEVLVVDNGSEDDTAEVIASYATVLPIVCVREPQAGLSNARNAGVRHARGRYIVWTDDDVRLDEGWLTAYVQAFETFSDAAVFGGSAVPVLEEPTPAWFSQNEFIGLLAHRDPRGLPRQLSIDGPLPWGLNFAIRAIEQRSHLYDPLLGVAPGRRRCGEEEQVIGQILASGAKGYWVPDAIVLHIIPASRQTLEYVKSYFKAQGETKIVREESAGRRYGTRELVGSIRRAARQYLLYRLRKLDHDSFVWIKHFKKFAYEAGAVEYLLSSDRRRTLRSATPKGKLDFSAPGSLADH